MKVRSQRGSRLRLDWRCYVWILVLDSSQLDYEENNGKNQYKDQMEIYDYKLEDLDFVDDIALISSSFQHGNKGYQTEPSRNRTENKQEENPKYIENKQQVQ